MSETRRELWLLISTTFRVDARRALSTLLEPIGQATGPLCGLWLSMLVNGALEQKESLVAAGIGGLAGSQALGTLSELVGTNLRVTLSEKVGFEFDQKIAQLTASLPGLEHQEAAEYQDKLELLRHTQRLGQSLDNLIVAASAATTAIIVLILLTATQPILLVMVAFGIPSAVAAGRYQRWVKDAEERSAEPTRLARHLLGLMVQPEGGIELRVYALRDEILTRHRDATRRAQDPIRHVSKMRALISFAEEALFIGGYIGAVAWTMISAINNEVTVGQVVLVAVVGAQVPAKVLGPIYSVTGLGRALRTAGRFLWLEDYSRDKASEVGDSRGSAPRDLKRGISLQNVGFRYPNSTKGVLEGVSVLLPAGTVVAVVGDNGAGKTTLVKLLCRMYEPTEGRIEVDGADLLTLDIDDWRAGTSGAFQDFARFELTALESIGVGDLSHLGDEAVVAEAANQAGAASVIAGLPSGLQSQLGASWPDGVDLSTGQWQKLALSRCLMRSTPLLTFLDEPTASLDAMTEHALYEKYAGAAESSRGRGSITLLVSHRFSTVSMADVILVLDQGHLVEFGSHDELMDKNGYYADLYNIQATGFR